MILKCHDDRLSWQQAPPKTWHDAVTETTIVFASRGFYKAPFGMFGGCVVVGVGRDNITNSFSRIHDDKDEDRYQPQKDRRFAIFGLFGFGKRGHGFHAGFSWR